MKLKTLAFSIAVMMGNAYGQTTKFETSEYLLSKSLKLINASSAYSRGYTGKDSVIGIIDTGIDTSSDQFKNKILFVQDFSSSGTVIDRVGHGTHVAGIAAAAKDEIGVHGVAYDAKLIIAKVTDNGSVGTATLINALSWVNSTGADVANMSLGWMVSSNYSMAKQIGTGLYSTKFSNTGTLPIGSLFDVPALVKSLQSEMVIVISAGNDKTKWSQGLAGLATLTDSKGNLALGGRMIIAGNYDQNTNQINPTSNGAAHLCQNVVKGVMNQEYCADKFKTWEFYILAPGTSILSTVPKIDGIPQKLDASFNPTGLATMTGTSMSAPAVSGAVAIIHQMWPQMKGANIVRLLLVTANKTIPNYNMYVHGQGLLDLEKATRPIGNLGIPTTGRLSGPNLTNVRPLIYTGGSASTGGLTSVMVVDEFERDFYTDSKLLTAYKIKPQFNLNQMMFTYEGKNPYVLFNNYSHKLVTGNNTYEFSMYRDLYNMQSTVGMLEFGYKKDYDYASVKFTGGYFNESNTWLGNTIGSFMGEGNNKNSHTTYMGMHVNKQLANTNLYASFITGVTNTNSNSENITSIGKAYSNTYTMGAEHNVGNNTFGLMYYKPVTIHRAMADIVAPVGLDSEFNVVQNSRANLAASVKEHRVGFYHKFEDKKYYKSMAFIESRYNYRGQEGMKDTAVGVNFTKYFY